MKTVVSYLLAASMVLPNAASVFSQTNLEQTENSENVTSSSESSTSSSESEASSSESSTSSSESETSSSESSTSSSGSETSSESNTSSSESEASSSDSSKPNSSASSNGDAGASSSESTSSSGASSSSSKAESDGSKNHPSSGSDSSSASSESSSEAQEEDVQEEQPAPAWEGGSQIEFSLKRALPLEKDLPAVVTLKRGEATVGEPKTITLGKSEKEVSCVFSGLEHGEYTVTVKAPGFELWEQTVSVSSEQAVSLQVYTDYVQGYTYDTTSVHPGAISIGDVNGDNTVDYNDSKDLLDVMAAQSKGNEIDFVGDLNGDGLVDLLDLQHLANSLDSKNSATSNHATPSTRSFSVGVAEKGTEIVGGSTESLMTDGGNVQLQPKDGGNISEENPVALTFNFAGEDKAATPMQAITIEGSKENPVTSGTIQVTYINENGEEVTDNIPVVPKDAPAMFKSGVVATVDENGNISVDFGNQIAVKKVTFTITGNKNNTNLAEISKVEFVNDMENRIPAPEMDIPKNVQAQAGDKEFVISWDEAKNITGYEVEITADGKTETRMTSSNELKVVSFDNDKLVNGKEYKVRVQSVNGDWRSGYGEAITVRPMATEKPPAPDNLKVEGAYRSLKISWKAMEDTDTYDVYYRPYEQGEYILAASGLTKNQYTISDLEPDTKYQVYVVGKNDIGYSEPSLIGVGQTLNLNPVQMPNYKLINTSNGEGEVSAHIKNVERRRSGATMENSPLDAEGQTALGLVDGDENSFYRVGDWDDGCAYPARNSKGLMFEFDSKQSIGSISFSEPVDNNFINGVLLESYNPETKQYTPINARLTRTKAENGRYYYTLKWSGEVVTDHIYMAVKGWNPLQISEVKFYSYDSIADDVDALFADEYHTELKKDVNEETLVALEERLNTKDSVSGEYHPDREMLQNEINNARSILNTESLGGIFSVKNTITARNDSYGFSGLNAWQPLGVVANEGDKLVVYVGGNNQQIGQNAELHLIATQYHAEAKEMMVDLGQLKIGRNEIEIPAINSLDAEHGGALYVQYTGGKGGAQYGVRVSGGTKVPVLDLYEVTDPAERAKRTLTYVQELQEYSKTIEQKHNELHTENGAYDEQNCTLGATDILLDEMMLSLPVQQVLNGLKGSTAEEKAVALEKSMTAMDEMMELFYQHKGFNDNNKDTQLPSQHLNIRYQRMFAGAFMYASGNHIGVEWNETAGMMAGDPVVADEMGKYISGQYFGWGIGHEIGHNINQGSYAVAEVTNNYFAQLAQARETSDSVRFKYSDVYKKVTSNTIGSSDNVFTQLAMYWQLHLAYDNYYNFKTFDNYDEQMANLFYARVDTYARNPQKAPAPGGVALTLSNSADQNFMRLATAAAQKDLTDFFVRWGKQPDAQTGAYAAQFEKESRAIYYVNDDARSWRIENPQAEGFGGKDVVADTSTVSADGNAVTIKLNNNLQNQDELLGYEITRVMTSGGQKVKQVVGFTTEAEFTDYVTSINNRVIGYEVTAIDQKLNRSAVKELDSVKISHDGSHDKSLWSIHTNMTSDQDETPNAGENEPCAPEKESAISLTIDNDASTVYTGKSENQDAMVQLDFNKTLSVTGLKYKSGGANAIREYEIQISTDNAQWKTIASGEFKEGEETSVIYFQNENNDPWVATYDAASLRLIAKGQKGENISIAELDVLGPTGDNVDWRTDEQGNETIGILEEDYVYDSASGEMIPAGSLVFVGEYKGNPAYNVVMLFDQDGNIVGGIDDDGALVAQQIIMAEVPEHGELGETTDGSWIYWIEPNATGGFGTLPETVRAELYRVDKATTNEGQRLVSDSFAVQMPEELPNISLK